MHNQEQYSEASFLYMYTMCIFLFQSDSAASLRSVWDSFFFWWGGAHREAAGRWGQNGSINLFAAEVRAAINKPISEAERGLQWDDMQLEEGIPGILQTSSCTLSRGAPSVAWLGRRRA